jgi:hypothetical protein
LKNRNTFSKPNFELGPKPRQVRQVRRVNRWLLGLAFIKFPKNSWADMLQGLVLKGKRLTNDGVAR